MAFILYNGRLLPAEAPALMHTNRGFRYGDALFETIRVWQGAMPLAAYHFQRLFDGARLLHFPMQLTEDALSSQILELCHHNHCTHSARVRLTLSRSEANGADYLIEAVDYPHSLWQPSLPGWSISIYPHARKACDPFAALKSASRLHYVMAELHARQTGVDESLVLNPSGYLADGSRTNLFLFQKGDLYTPALNQGCVSGVMRRHVMELAKQQGLQVHETQVGEQDLLEADEVFLTNALIGIQPVRSFGDKGYVTHLTLQLAHSIGLGS